MPKRSIRAQFLAERKSRSVDFCADSSRKIQQRCLQSTEFARASCVALYSPIQNEVQTDLVARQVLESGKLLVYPKVKGDELEFRAVADLSDLKPGAFNVLEPNDGQTVPVEELDLIAVPGIVFDKAGHRLGYGRGYYDRTLTRCRRDCARAGFAYDFQLVERLPSAGHDETLSVLLTESCTLTFTA